MLMVDCASQCVLWVCVCAENPSETAARTLKLVAKVLQMLANLVDAGPKVSSAGRQGKRHFEMHPRRVVCHCLCC